MNHDWCLRMHLIHTLCNQNILQGKLASTNFSVMKKNICTYILMQ